MTKKIKRAPGDVQGDTKSQSSQRGRLVKGTAYDKESWKICPECGGRIAADAAFDIHPVCEKKKKKGS